MVERRKIVTAANRALAEPFSVSHPLKDIHSHLFILKKKIKGKRPP